MQQHTWSTIGMSSSMEKWQCVFEL